jgi:hypothetical protein
LLKKSVNFQYIDIHTWPPAVNLQGRGCVILTPKILLVTIRTLLKLKNEKKMAQHAHTTVPFGFSCYSNGRTADTGVDLKS